MKVWKYDRYVENLKESISKVEKAIQQGALLTDMELFDFHFKQFLYGESYNFLKGIRDSVYRTAKYSADMFDELQNIRKNAKVYVPYILTCLGTVAMYYMIGFLS